MKRRIVSLIVSIAALCVLGFFVGCKQGKGERCQVKEDCEGDLQCNQATLTCQDLTGGQIDAMPPDGNGSGADAGVDAPVDAPPIDAPLG